MSTSQSQHVSVLTAEVLAQLELAPGQIVLDGTLGGGGHARAILQRIGPTGLLVAFDRDPAAIERAASWSAGMPVRFCQTNFCDAPEALDQLNIDRLDGVILDLGLSSDQLADRERGFSFQSEGPLDLRFNPHEGEPASRLVNRLSEAHLADLIYHYGEDRLSRRIAREIVAARRARPIETAAELADVVRRAVPRSRDSERIDPATRTFQALRIAVNEELKSLEIALRRLPDRLRPGGRLAIISFHSLEDRRVKEAFRDDPRLAVITKKPLRPADDELARNPRARSAKLRVASRRATD
jgi:16S rRNA (cytosine1402-N4)-methyltransferase